MIIKVYQIDLHPISCCPYLYFGSAIMLVTCFVNFRQLNDHLFGKELFIRFAANAFRKLPSVYVFSYFPFGFEGRMWDLIVSVPDHCLFFTLLNASRRCLMSRSIKYTNHNRPVYNTQRSENVRNIRNIAAVYFLIHLLVKTTIDRIFLHVPNVISIGGIVFQIMIPSLYSEYDLYSKFVSFVIFTFNSIWFVLKQTVIITMPSNTCNWLTV